MMDAPQENPDFMLLSAIDRAIVCKDYLGYLERLTNDTKAHYEIACREAFEKNEQTSEYCITAKYTDGKTMTPDAKLLEEKFPAKYRAWIMSEQETYIPKLTKKAIEQLWKVEGSTKEEKQKSKERNAEEIKSICVEKAMNPQFMLSRIADKEKWSVKE